MATNELILGLNPNSVFPGQVVDAFSVQVYFENIMVQTFEFDFDLLQLKSAVERSLLEIPSNVRKFGDSDGKPTTLLPDGTAAHVKVGDYVVADNVLAGGGVYRSQVIGIETNTSGQYAIRFADPISYQENSNKVVTFRIYRSFDMFKLTDTSAISTTHLNDGDGNPRVVVGYNAQPYPKAANGYDYVFATPNEVYGGKNSTGYVGYKAQRVDTVGTILTISTPDEAEGTLGVLTEENPLGLGVSIAMGNTTTSVRALAVETDDREGYAKALDLLESERVYAITPLTQEVDILTMVKAHVEQLSMPLVGMWRIAYVNTKIPTADFIGQARPLEADAVGGISDTRYAGTIVGVSGATTSNVLSLNSDSPVDASFVTEGVTPGDKLVVTGAEFTDLNGEYVIDKVLDNNTLRLTTKLTVNAKVKFVIRRDLTRAQQAERVAATSSTFGTKRIIHVMPDVCGIKVGGVTKYLPGYYLGCALAGMTAGFPVQQGFTNLTLAGVETLMNSNYYFTREQLNTMAAAGTCLFVQDTQTSPPYCRHELTTDMTVLEYREILKVKNWDYLSYFYKDLLDPFIGTWNITEDTLLTIKQTIISASENLKTQKLPKIGSPLISYNIDKLEQNATSKDTIDCRIKVEIVSPNNYTDVDLVI